MLRDILEAKTESEGRILDYLVENASDALKNKIICGYTIMKDGVEVFNQKTLQTFMKYAEEEARKLLAKGERAIMVEDALVYSWAIHYFEEESIEGILLNADGTEYKPKTPAKTVSTSKVVTNPKVETKPQSTQYSLFDELLDEPKEKEFVEEEEIEVAAAEAKEEVNEEPVADGVHWISETQYVDDLGELHDIEPEDKPSIDYFDIDAMQTIQKLLGNIVIAR